MTGTSTHPNYGTHYDSVCGGANKMSMPFNSSIIVVS